MRLVDLDRPLRRLIRGAPSVMCLLLAWLVLPSAATAAPAAKLTIHTEAVPTRFSAADTEKCLQSVGVAAELPSCDAYQVTVVNSGALPTSKPLTLTDVLPAGLHVVPSGGEDQVRFFLGKNQEKVLFEGEKLEESLCKPEESSVSCEFSEPLLPDQRLELKIYMTTEPGAIGAVNTASVVEAGGGEPASTSEDDVIGSTLPPFGASGFSSTITRSDGGLETQAGAHPYEFTNRIDLNTKFALSTNDQIEGLSVQGVRDVVVDLPLGFLGSATATPLCTFAQLESPPQSCPPDTLVGHLGTEPGVTASANSPIYNMVPERGAAAEFGFRDLLYGTHVIVANVAPTPAGYVLRATAREVPEISLTDIVTTFFGDPAARNGGGALPAAMFTNPSDCSGQPLITTVHMDSWQNPGRFNPDGTPNLENPAWVSTASESPAVTGCNQLRFIPEAFSVKPETATADVPTGLYFDLKLPQPETPETLATPPLRDASVTLPEGLTLDPSAASGLESCSEAQIGWLGTHGPKGEASANRGLTNFTAAAPGCPEASKVASVAVTSPLIPGTLEGSVFLARQFENPYNSLLAGYVVIDDPTTGTIVKIPGEIKTNPETGQITGIFNENPQFPFSELKIHFFGGPRGDLATPEACGTYTTTSDLMPWSAPNPARTRPRLTASKSTMAASAPSPRPSQPARLRRRPGASARSCCPSAAKTTNRASAA